MKVTVPVGWPFAPAGTEALSVIEFPNREGVRLELSVTVLEASTIWLRTGEVLDVLLASPLYTAVSAWVPAASDAVLKVAVATPAMVESVPLPRDEPPSSKVTVPVGVNEPVGSTVAVKVMLCPLTDGLLLEASGVV